MRQHLVFGNERRRRVLHDHVAAVHAAPLYEEGRQARKRGIDHALDAPLGNVRDLRKSNTRKVEAERHRLAVEVAARDHLFRLRKDNGIVRDGIDLDLHFVLHVMHRVLAGAVHLGSAAQGIGVLYPLFPCRVTFLLPLSRSDTMRAVSI